MVAAAQRADLALPSVAMLHHRGEGRHPTGQGVVTRLQAGDATRAHVALVVHPEADRHPRLDLRSHRAEGVRQGVRVDREPGGDHPAADVHSDRGRHDRAAGRDDRADGRSDPGVYVRHRGHVRMYERQARDLLELPHRVGGHVLGPDAHRHRGVFDGLLDGHGSMPSLPLLSIIAFDDTRMTSGGGSAGVVRRAGDERGAQSPAIASHAERRSGQARPPTSRRSPARRSVDGSRWFNAPATRGSGFGVWRRRRGRGRMIPSPPGGPRGIGGRTDVPPARCRWSASRPRSRRAPP